MPVASQHISGKILIVEDSSSDIRMLGEILSGMAQIRFAMTGEDAIRMADAEDFDVILLDVMLPDMSGFEVCKAVVGDADAPPPSVVFVTSLEGSEHEEKGLSLGALDYIAKPIVPALVQARVRNHLMLSQTRRELMEKNEQLTKLATTDTLTGVYNRRHFNDILNAELERCERHGQDLALMMLDLDHFKAINDCHGHIGGDNALIEAVRAWQGVLRTTDTLGRVGGEEFAVLLPHTDCAQVEHVAHRLLEATRALRISGDTGDVFSFSVSIGAAFRRDDDASTLIKRADRALYQAKDQGRNRAVCCPLEVASAATAAE